LKNRSLILLRGLPGAGKTTLARLLAGAAPVFSVDDYFTSPGGDYRFEYDKNHLAYRQCEDRTRRAMEADEEKIFLDNVFSMEWEMEPYFRMAAEFGYTVHVVTVENRHGSGNVHGITAEQLRKMADKYRIVLLAE
jgi:predicted kinase